MRRIVLDIETNSVPFDTLSESQKEYLLRYAEKEKDEKLRSEKIDEAVRYTSLYPFTSKIIAIGIYDVEKEKTFVYYDAESEEQWNSEDKKICYKGLPEKEIIKSFWKIVEVVDQVITFNGRNFDIPFLILRSAILRIKPSENLMGSRYNFSQHIDLLDQLTFYGLTRKFNLDFYCNAFGIKSPKTKDVSGMEVKNLYEAGRTKDIAIYCADDVHATYELYKIWNEYLNL